MLTQAPGAQAHAINASRPTIIAYSLPFYTVSEAVSGGGSLTGVARLQNEAMEDRNLSCPGACGAKYPYALGEGIELVEHPQPGATFVGWRGACAGSASTCSFTVSAAATVTATFTAVQSTPQPNAPGAGGAAGGAGEQGQGEEAPGSSVAHLPARLLGLRALHGHQLQVTVACRQAKPCHLILVASSDVPGARLVASRTITLASGHSGHLSLALNHEGTRLLARRRRLPVTVRLVLIKAGRQITVGRGGLTLVA
jgi:Divergent InlB B-repeat domain